MATFKNLCPHPVRIVGADGRILTLPPATEPARVVFKQRGRRILGGIYVAHLVVRTITHLPDPEEEVVYVASFPVARAAREAGRRDIYYPDSGPSALRNPDGEIFAVRGLLEPT